jgi:hypothetical protein
MPIDEATKAKLNTLTCPNLTEVALGTIIQDLQNGVVAGHVDEVGLHIGAGNTIELKNLGVVTGRIADDAVTKAKVNADVAGAGLGQNADGSLEAKVDGSTIEIAADTLQVKAGGIGAAQLAADIALTIRHRVTAAEVNAGHTLVTPPSGRAVRLVDVALIAIGGAAAGATTVDILDGATKLLAAAVAGLTQSALLRAGAANAAILADGASFVALDADDVITIGKTGDDLSGCTHIDVILTYALA